MKIKESIQFYRLAKKRAFSQKDYLNFESFQANLVMKSLKKNGISVRGKKVLDLGAGRGGYSLIMSKSGADVYSVDRNKKNYQNIKGAHFIHADATRLPFKDDCFEFIFCSSLIEHIEKPDLLISEIKRVLKKNGICYLSFPPFWSPVGAHQFKPFHYLGEKAAVKFSRIFYNVRSQRYNDVHGNLYKRTIKQVKKLILHNGLKIKKISTRFSPINFAKIPIFNDILTWHVEFLIQK